MPSSNASLSPQNTHDDIMSGSDMSSRRLSGYHAPVRFNGDTLEKMTLSGANIFTVAPVAEMRNESMSSDEAYTPPSRESPDPPVRRWCCL